MDTNDTRRQESAPVPTERPRRAWTSPRLVDHGSLRWFVRSVSGNADDGHTSSAGGGGTMESKPKQT